METGGELMDWSFYGPLALIVGFFLLVLGQKIGYNEGRQDERQEQERRKASMPEPTPAVQPALDWIDKLEQEINGR